MSAPWSRQAKVIVVGWVRRDQPSGPIPKHCTSAVPRSPSEPQTAPGAQNTTPSARSTHSPPASRANPPKEHEAAQPSRNNSRAARIVESRSRGTPPAARSLLGGCPPLPCCHTKHARQLPASLLGQGSGTRDNLDKLGGNAGLAGPAAGSWLGSKKQQVRL